MKHSIFTIIVTVFLAVMLLSLMSCGGMNNDGGITSDSKTTEDPSDPHNSDDTADDDTNKDKDDDFVDGSEGLEYIQEGSSYIVSGIGNCSDADLVVPSSYMGKPVTAIAKDAFKGCDFLTSVTVPDCVESIGDGAFADCGSLVSLDLSRLNTILHRLFLSVSSVTDYIKVSDTRANIFPDDDRFYSLSFSYFENEEFLFFRIPKSLKKVSVRYGSLPSERYRSYLTRFDDIGTFEAFANLEEIIVPDELTTVNPRTFVACYSLKGNVKDGLMYVGSASNPDLILISSKEKDTASFEVSPGCKFICMFEDTVDYKIDDYISDIEIYPFFGSDTGEDLITVFLNDLLDYNDTSVLGVFEGMTKLKSVTLPDGLLEIGPLSFKDCSALEELDIPDTVKSINDMAFYDCSSLKKLHLPKKIEKIGSWVFSRCDSIEEMNIPELPDDAYFAFEDCICPLCNEYGGFCFLGTEAEPYKYYTGPIDNKLESYEVPNGVVAIYIAGLSPNEIKLPKSLCRIYGNPGNMNKVIFAGTSNEWFSIDFGSYNPCEIDESDYDEYDEDCLFVECTDRKMYVYMDWMP